MITPYLADKNLLKIYAQFEANHTLQLKKLKINNKKSYNKRKRLTTKP